MVQNSILITVNLCVNLCICTTSSRPFTFYGRNETYEQDRKKGSLWWKLKIQETPAQYFWTFKLALYSEGWNTSSKRNPEKPLVKTIILIVNSRLSKPVLCGIYLHFLTDLQWCAGYIFENSYLGGIHRLKQYCHCIQYHPITLDEHSRNGHNVHCLH